MNHIALAPPALKKIHERTSMSLNNCSAFGWRPSLSPFHLRLIHLTHHLAVLASMHFAIWTSRSRHYHRPGWSCLWIWTLCEIDTRGLTGIVYSHTYLCDTTLHALGCMGTVLARCSYGMSPSECKWTLVKYVNMGGLSKCQDIKMDSFFAIYWCSPYRITSCSCHTPWVLWGSRGICRRWGSLLVLGA